MRLWRTVTLLVGTCLSGLPSPAAAQAANPWELSGGYAYLQDSPNNTSLPAGWIAGTAVALTDWLAAVGEVGGNSHTTGDVHLSTYAVMAGARPSVRIGRLTEFGQLVVGAAHSASTVFDVTSTDTSFAVQPGAGLDYPLASRLAARLQVDFRYIAGSGHGEDPRHNFRFVAALVYHGCCK